jgi:hypothetical protein
MIRAAREPQPEINPQRRVPALIKKCALIADMLGILSAPVHAAGVCPSDAEVTAFKSCSNAARNPAEIERCSARWKLAKDWCGLLSGEHITEQGAKPAPMPQQVSPSHAAGNVPPSCGPTSLQNCACGPQLTMALTQRIEQANPGSDQLIKAMALRQGLELMGCLAPQPSQTTNCLPLGGGAFTCTTR